MSADALKWTPELDQAAQLMLQGAHAWETASSMTLDLPEALAMIDKVRILWGREATHGLDPALDESLAQLRRIKDRSWDAWQKDKDPRVLRQIRETELSIMELQEQVADVLAAAETEDAIADLPAWVSVYLAAWGSKRPDNKRRTVSWAARIAGTNPSNVRTLRQRSSRFRTMEDLARHTDTRYAQSLVDSGLRGNAPIILESFMALVRDRHPQSVLKAVEWLADKPAFLLKVAAMSDDEIRARYTELLRNFAGDGDAGGDGQGAGADPAASPEAEAEDTGSGTVPVLDTEA